MHDLNGKTAIISGGAAGIGLAVARALGARGMNLVLADIESKELAQATATLESEGLSVLGVEMDVALQEDWERTAQAAQERFGRVHLLLNNAGVSGGIGSLETLDVPGWQWTIDVNLMGVVYGAHTLLTHMKTHGEPAWIINVASMAGMAGVPLAGAYTATKAAVVALSEAWAVELANTNVHVAVLAPAFVRTRIHQSYRNRQARYGAMPAPTPDVLQIGLSTTKAVENGIPPETLAARVLEALDAGEHYIFTHPLYQSVTDGRSEAVRAAFERTARSPVVGEVDERPSALGFGAD